MSQPHTNEAIVYRSTGSWYVLKDVEGAFRNARIKGKFKIDEEISSTNPLAIGDKVLVEQEDTADADYVIKDIIARKNYIVRVSPHNRHQKHIVAANLDQAILITTLKEPRTSTGFIDRFLITAEAYHIPVVIVINKSDILKEKQQEQLQHWQQMFGNAGYEVMTISAKTGAGIDQLRAKISGKVSLFSGHSGVGKSTLINTLLPGMDLRTSAVSDWSGKGLHTTTFAEMFDIPNDSGSIIDTPGVKEFGLIDLEREELSHYFPEMRAVLTECKFNNCLHLNEPGCAVKLAVNEGRIEVDRYASYMGILDTIEKKW